MWRAVIGIALLALAANIDQAVAQITPPVKLHLPPFVSHDCLPGYVWREARASDLVCVIPQSRDLAAEENAKAVSRRESGPRDGVYYCLSGYVWREAYSGDTTCVIPAARDRVLEENTLSASRAVGGGPDFRSPGQHTLLVGVTNSRPASETKVFSSNCGTTVGSPPFAGMVGWGQSKIGWLGDSCAAFVAERAVQFDATLMNMIPTKIIDRVVLSYDEVEGPFPDCSITIGYSYRCWQNGQGEYQYKTDGCAVVRVPAVDWINNGGKYGRLPTKGEQTEPRINGRQWDVTRAISWQLVRSSAPLGAFPGYGLLLTGGPSLDSLRAEDHTMCASELSNITLTITYTVPPDGGAFIPPR